MFYILSAMICWHVQILIQPESQLVRALGKAYLPLRNTELGLGSRLAAHF
jgi:hypothetical protein